MVTASRCSCLNVTIHLEHAPTPVDDQWLLSYVPRCSIGHAAISVAGICKSVDFLVDVKTVEHNEQSWRCVICTNCDSFIYAYEIAKPANALVNMDLLPRLPENERQSIGENYSKVWRVILIDEDNVSNTVVETPDEEDTERFAMFQLIRNQMRDYLKRSEQEMQERIRLFTEQQHQLYQEEQAKAFTDRKLLWFKACKVHSSKHISTSSLKSLHDSIDSTIDSTSDSQTGTPSRSDALDDGVGAAVDQAALDRSFSMDNDNLIANDATPSFAPPPSDPAPLPPGANPPPLPPSDEFAPRRPKSGSDLGIFRFDDMSTPNDDDDDGDSLNVDEPNTDDNYDVIDDGYDDYRPKRGALPGQYLACSMPVTVPARFRSFGLAQDERAAAAAAAAAANERSNQNDMDSSQMSLGAARRGDDRSSSNDSAALLSQSFAVPVSRTRQLKGFL